MELKLTQKEKLKSYNITSPEEWEEHAYSV